MRPRRSILKSPVIPSVGDIFDLSTSSSYPTTYEVIQVNSSPETLIIFRLYDNETNKNIWQMTINSVGEKKILGISGQYIISEFRKPPTSPRELLVENTTSTSQTEKFETIPPLQLSRQPLTNRQSPPSSPRERPVENIISTSQKSTSRPQGRMLSSRNPQVSTVESKEVLVQNLDPFQNLPRDMLGEIVSSLDPLSLLKFCQTSKRISEFCKNEDFWVQRLKQDFPDRIQSKDPKISYRQYYNWLSLLNNTLVLNLLENPDDEYNKFFHWNRDFSTRNRLYILYQQKQRRYPVEPVYKRKFLEKVGYSIKKGETPLSVFPIQSETDNNTEVFSASQIIGISYNKDPGSIFFEPDRVYTILTNESSPRSYNPFSIQGIVGWASNLVGFVTGYRYELYRNKLYEYEIVESQNNDLNALGTIIVLLSIFRDRIWEYQIPDPFTFSRIKGNRPTLEEVRLKLISKLKNQTLLVPDGFLNNIDKILDLTYKRQ